MALLFDGWNAIVQFPGLILALVFCAAWGGMLISAFFGNDPDIQLAAAGHLALAVAGWPGPVLLLAVMGLALGWLAGPLHPAVILTFMAATGGAAIYMQRRAARPQMPLLILASVFALLFFLRLAFISGMLLPAYFDSAEHYRIARSLVDAAASARGPVSWPAPAYYHLGFHAVTALLAVALQADIKSVMLVLGQVLLACIPIPFYFIVKRITRSHAAGLWAVLLAGLGWSMPAHAADWGKYPALASILTIQFAACLALLSSESPGASKTSGLRVLLAGSLIVSFLFHTRSVIVIAILIAAWRLAGGWLTLPRAWRSVTLALSAGLLAVFIHWTRAGDLRLTFDPYLRAGGLVTGLAALSFPFAIRLYARPALAGLFSILLMCAALLVPVGGPLPGYAGLTLLDRPLVEMLLFMPLAWIGGLGLAGLLQTWDAAAPRLEKVSHAARSLVPILLAAFVTVHAFVQYDFKPSDCCTIAGYDDAAALDWLDENLPSDAVIAIAAAQLTLRNPGPERAIGGIDAGVWIAPLTGRQTSLLPYTFDFGAVQTPPQLCAQGISHVYVGGERQSFPASLLDGRPEWYRPVFYLPEAQIFEVHACP
jgi:hypothetical protein